MNIKIRDYRIQEIIHNISDDFRFSNKHEKYAHLFYSVEGVHEIDKKSYDGMLEYITIAQKKLKEDILWKEKIIDENSDIKERKLLEMMKTIQKEYEELYLFLTTSIHTS